MANYEVELLHKAQTSNRNASQMEQAINLNVLNVDNEIAIVLGLSKDGPRRRKEVQASHSVVTDERRINCATTGIRRKLEHDTIRIHHVM